MEHNSSLSTLDTTVVAQESFRPVEWTFTELPFINLDDPNAAAQICEQAAQVLREHFPQMAFDAFLSSLAASVPILQGMAKTRSEELNNVNRCYSELHEKHHDLEQKHTVLQETLRHSLNRNTVLSRLLDTSKKEAAGLVDQNKAHQEELTRVLKDMGDLELALDTVREERALQEETLTSTSKRLVWVAREALKYRRANVLHAFPDLTGMMRSLHWEVSVISAKLNGHVGVPGAQGLSAESQTDELMATVQRATRLADDTIDYLERVETASRELTGPLGESTIEKEIDKAARGFHPRHILDVVDRFNLAPKKADNRPFRVNFSAIRAFLSRANSPASPAPATAPSVPTESFGWGTDSSSD
ncbi:hypothetical protein V5O48_016259 [Marasmius crinis-equi]|uniref:Uncharacterized protein n=1 Tax=Marasmius crinis-equi TaxID=585013 RepID=A0ABR3ESH6_9AGAR